MGSRGNRKWIADKEKNDKAPKFFGEDGDPTMELSNSIYDMEHYAYAKIKHFVDKGMNKLELRAFAERLINAVQMAALTYMPHIPRSEK